MQGVALHKQERLWQDVCDTLSTGISTAEAALSQVQGDELVAQEPCLSTRLEQLQAEGLALEAAPCEDSIMEFVRCVAARCDAFLDFGCILAARHMHMY
jgi:hypothetical protein